MKKLQLEGLNYFLYHKLGFTQQKLTVFTTTEIPLYQNLKGVQVGSQYQVTAGLNYQFIVVKNKIIKLFNLDSFSLLLVTP